MPLNVAPFKDEMTFSPQVLIYRRRAVEEDLSGRKFFPLNTWLFLFLSICQYVPLESKCCPSLVQTVYYHFDLGRLPTYLDFSFH